VQVNRFLLAGVLVLGLLIAPAVIAVGEAQPRHGGTFVTAVPYSARTSSAGLLESMST
jgi:hypothetical protein